MIVLVSESRNSALQAFVTYYVLYCQTLLLLSYPRRIANGNPTLTVSSKHVRPKLDRIQVMTLSMPHLTVLSLPNGLRIRKDLQYIQHLQSLRTLDLGSIDGLGIEFNLPQCGFAWGQLERDPVRMAHLQADRSSALQETKRRVRSTFPRLERMILDGK
ncbi:hypothetical protein EXIGLDRAFT_333313 [Exidia glandulosa HHB12029]|uniref:Uncharacterized protein n=1 Tax=Exidia glandulosa HHB12029 TaxID=1314781 RepID=A0A165LMQ1_EXIGL|nr:hypothetical protein EXIGLDRAFT_333313 [Exidia glandulosa HHB12029]